PGQIELERLVEGERDRLARAFGQVLAQLARGAEAEGRFESAAEWWHRLAATEPLNANITINLMRAQLRLGAPAAAFRTFRRYETMMRDDLDAPPDPAVLAVVEQIRKSGNTETARLPYPVPPIARPVVDSPSAIDDALMAAVPNVPANPPPRAPSRYRRWLMRGG